MLVVLFVRASPLPPKTPQAFSVIVMPGSPSGLKVATSEVAKQLRGRCHILVVLVADPSDDWKSWRCYFEFDAGI